LGPNLQYSKSGTSKRSNDDAGWRHHFGSVPEYYDANGDQSNSDHVFFYICREGATMYNGFARYVPQVVDVGTNGGQELKQCDRNAGKWKTVSECEDGFRQ